MTDLGLEFLLMLIVIVIWTVLDIPSQLGYSLQAIRLKYFHPDSELQDYALQVMDMLRADIFVDSHALVNTQQICCLCQWCFYLLC